MFVDLVVAVYNECGGGVKMTTISMFYGILMKMYREQGGKHKLPHVHAEYVDYEAVFDFDGNLLEGELPRK